LISDWSELKRCGESDQDLAQQKAAPADETAEVVADCGEDGVGGIAMLEPEVVAAHAVLGASQCRSDRSFEIRNINFANGSRL